MHHDELVALPPAGLRAMLRPTRKVAADWLAFWRASESGGYGPAVCGGDLGRYMRFALMASDVEGALLEVERDRAWNAGFLAGGADAEAWYNERTGERNADRG